MPRPPKTEHQRRNKSVETSLTEEEHAYLVSAALTAGKRFTDFVRQIVLAAELPLSRRSRLRGPAGRGGRRLQIWLSYAEREQLHARAAAAALTTSDYVYRALIEHVGYEPDEGVVRLRLDPARAKSLEKRAATARQPLGTFVLRQTFAEGTADAYSQYDPMLLVKLDKLLKEFNAIGVNINQLAHKANAGRVLPGLWQQAAIELAAQTKKADELLDQIAMTYGP